MLSFLFTRKRKKGKIEGNLIERHPPLGLTNRGVLIIEKYGNF